MEEEGRGGDGEGRGREEERRGGGGEEAEKGDSDLQLMTRICAAMSFEISGSGRSLKKALRALLMQVSYKPKEAMSRLGSAEDERRF